MRSLFMAAFIAVTLSCAATTTIPHRPVVYNTIQVKNESIDVLRIYGDRGRIGTASPGETVCLNITQPGQTVLVVYAVGGGKVVSAPMDTFSHSWAWTVYRMDAISSINTMPAARCRR